MESDLQKAEKALSILKEIKGNHDEVIAYVQGLVDYLRENENKSC